MAKIALITENLTPHALDLAKALHQQKQEVILISSQSEKEKAPSNISVRFPFRSWSIKEALRALPSLISENFDVWHFLFTHEDNHPKLSHWLMAALAKTIPHKIVVSSFNGKQNFRNLKDEKFLSLMDLSLFPERSLLMDLKRKHRFANNSLTEILPPIDIFPAVTENTRLIREESYHLLQQLRSFILLPHEPPKFSWFKHSPVDLLVLQEKPKETLFAQSNATSRLFYTGNLSLEEQALFFSKAKALCLIYNDYSALDLQKYHRISEQFQLPLIVRKQQTEIYPGLCWQDRSGWIFADHDDGLQKLVVTNPDLKLAEAFANYPHNELIDSTLNELVRLYQKTYVKRWTTNPEI